MPFYYAVTDENHVLCVDQVGDRELGDPGYTAEEVAEKLASHYPHVIYFEVGQTQAEPSFVPVNVERDPYTGTYDYNEAEVLELVEPDED